MMNTTATASRQREQLPAPPPAHHTPTIGQGFAWDDQQQLLDELLLEIFTPPGAASDSAMTNNDWGELDAGNDTDGDAASSTYASPASVKYSSNNQRSQRAPGSPTASSSDESSGAYVGAGCSPGGLDMAAPGSPLSAKEKRQLEMRRKRNRESMRRVRQRKRIEYSELKKLLPGLEARLTHLRELKAQHERHVAGGAANAMLMQTSGSASAALASLTAAHNHAGPALVQAMEQLRIVEDAFRRENALLEREIDKYEQAFVAVQDLITEQQDAATSAAAASRNDCDALDYFAWTARVLPLLPQIQTDEIYDFVRRSVVEVVEQIEAAQSLDEAVHEILGWRVRRTIAGPWIRMVVSKDFVNEDVETVADKTWFVQSQSHTVNATMPQNHLMKVLRVVNDSTLVCARNLFFPGDETNYCTIYLLMRVKTPQGYVIAQRSLVPTDAALLARHLGAKFSYVNLFYGMILERHTSSSGDEDSAFAPSRGCKATFGGLAGNGTERYAQSSAKDLFIAMLRWESACVGPLYRLL